ncbi:MAG: glycosyltransferase [Chthoniobacteraceae bacterium]
MKADLHIHTKYSARAPEWFFRKIGLADSYSDPRALYDRLRAAGMDGVTFTDHNCIDGCLAIAELPGAFVSVQVSARFPEDRTKIHLLVWGVSEAQHGELQNLRDNIYEMQRYLAQHDLTHAVAHPFYRPSEPLPVVHVEKLVLLFRHFEGINGLRDRFLSDVARCVFGALTPQRIEEFANRHGLAPTHPEAWRKVLIGGSDDHGGLRPARAFTETPTAADAAEFLAHVRAGRCEARGEGGTPLTVSHGLYNNLRQFAGGRFAGAKTTSFVGKMFSRFMEGEDPTEFSWMEKLGFLAEGIASGQIFELAKPANASLWRHFATHFSQSAVKKRLAAETEGVVEPERRAFVTANFFASQLAFHFFTSLVAKASRGNPIEAIQDAAMLAPVLAPLAPYLYAFKSQAPDRRWLGEVSRALTGEAAPALRNTKRAWFTDTLEDVNGVANTIRRLTAACRAQGHDVVVVTSRSEITITDIPIKNFAPIGEFELPEYKLQKLSFPPILQMIDYIQREGFTELIISTPGPIGLTALLAAKLLGLRASGIYHTDFPQYIRILTDDSFLETLTWSYMKWFYDALDLIYVNSEGYRGAWIARGIDAEKLRILPRGLDTALFDPSRRDSEFWVKRGAARGATVLLYVGRISKEKDLDVIARAWPKLKRDGVAVAFVGDGPYRAEMEDQLPDAIFTGVLAGRELATAYASADVFVFPSTTDTFGNVILEALASGLPCVVSDQGGPKDLVEDGRTGFISRGLDVEDFARCVERAIGALASGEIRGATRAAVESRDWMEAGGRFWSGG